MKQNDFLWGVDLGGTKTECAVLEKKTGNVSYRDRIPTEQEGGYRHVLNQIKKVTETAVRHTGLQPQKLGIGTPGAIDSGTGLLKNSNTVCLNEKPVKEDLQKILNLPVVISNDANCFALAESTLGVVKDLNIKPEVVFGIIMGTGVGGGIIVNGKAINGCHGIAGEWGHNYLDESGGKCYCGKTGCVETVISGPALQKYYTRLSGNIFTLPEIIERQKSDIYAKETISRLHKMFGKAVANVINIIDPAVIILGGGLGNISSLQTEGVKEITPHLFNPVLNTIIVRPKLGDSAGVFGAAMLVK